MKRWLCLCLCAGLVFGAGGCGNTAEPTEQTAQQTQEEETNETNKNVKNVFEVRVDDAVDVVGNQERHIAWVYNTTDQYINSLVELILFDTDGNELCREPIFFMNTAPEWHESALIKIPIGEKIDSYDLNVIRFSSSDTPEKSPEITEENLYQYLYFTYIPIDGIDYGEATLDGTLHNLTTQYFSGTVHYFVKNENGEIVMDTIQSYSNLIPGGKEFLVDGAIPSKEYHVEYKITDFQFTDEPI